MSQMGLHSTVSIPLETCVQLNGRRHLYDDHGHLGQYFHSECEACKISTHWAPKISIEWVPFFVCGKFYRK